MKNKPSSPPVAGGAAIALCTVAGVLAGSIMGQPSMGFVGGIGTGVTIAIAIWLWDRSRR